MGSFVATPSTDVLGWGNVAVPGPQVSLEHPAKELEEHLEADLCDGRVVAALGELVADEGVLGPGELVEAGGDAGLAELGADEIATGVGDVGVLDAKDHGDLALEPVEEVEGVVAAGRSSRRGVGGFIRAQGARVDVRGEVGDAGGDSRVELAGASVGVAGGLEGLICTHGGAGGEMATETHARGTDEAGTRREGQEVVHRGIRVCVIGFERLLHGVGSAYELRCCSWRKGHLLDLELVATIGILDVVLEGFGPSEVVVGRGSSDDVALASNLASEAGDWAGYWSRG